MGDMATGLISLLRNQARVCYLLLSHRNLFVRGAQSPVIDWCAFLFVRFALALQNRSFCPSLLTNKC